MYNGYKTGYSKFGYSQLASLPQEQPRVSTAQSKSSLQDSQLNDIFLKKLAKKGKQVQSVAQRASFKKNEPVRVFSRGGQQQKAQKFKGVHEKLRLVRNEQTKKTALPEKYKMYGTSYDGFRKKVEERPQSKQQQRSGIIKPDLDEDLSIYSDHGSQTQEDLNIEDLKKENYYQGDHQNQRPKTSKGSRKLNSDLPRQVNPSRTPQLVEHNADQIQINNMFSGQIQRNKFFEETKDFKFQSSKRKDVLQKQERAQHCKSAKQSYKDRQTAIKFHVNSKKSGSNVRVPFETSIGRDFLKLFANEHHQ